MIVVDASVWVSLFVDQDVHYESTFNWFERLRLKEQWFAAPILVLPEVTGSVARRTGRPDLGRYAIHQLLRIPTLRLLPIDRELGLTAARHAADLQIRGADATYIVLARNLNASLVTWDNDMLARASKVIKVYTPEK
jgi:predicted nucleic acid-binding protein